MIKPSLVNKVIKYTAIALIASTPFSNISYAKTSNCKDPNEIKYIDFLTVQSFSGHRTAFTDIAGIDCGAKGNQYFRTKDFLKENNYSFRDILTINFNKPKISSKNLNQILLKNLKISDDEIFIRMKENEEEKEIKKNKKVNKFTKKLQKKVKKKSKKFKYYYFENGRRKNIILDENTNVFKLLSSNSTISAKTLCENLKNNFNSMSPHLEHDCYIKYR